MVRFYTNLKSVSYLRLSTSGLYLGKNFASEVVINNDFGRQTLDADFFPKTETLTSF